MKAVLIRRWSLIAAIVVIFGSIAISNLLGSMKEPPKKKDEGANVPLVKTMTVEPDTSMAALNVSGRLRAKDRITVFSEVTGRLSQGSKPFKEGNEFRRGEVLLKMDDTDFRMNLIATRSNFLSLLTRLQADLKLDYEDNFEAWQEYINDFDPEESIKPLPETKTQAEKNFIVSNNILNQYYAIKSQEEKLRKYTVYAPFSGAVIAANVTQGVLVRAGQPVGEFLNTETYEIELGVPMNDIDKIKSGDKVGLEDRTGNRSIGEITRISKSLDPQTQTFKVYAEVSGKDLHEGMYVEANIGRSAFPDAMPVPASLVIDGRYLYAVVNDSILVKREVEVVNERPGTRIVRGLKKGEQIISQPMPNAQDSMIVKVQNSTER